MMADFKTAVEWMKQGKKVKIKIWVGGEYIYWNNTNSNMAGNFKYSSGNIVDTFTIAMFESTDWVIFEEHFDLSKKAKDILSNRTGEEWTGIYYPESDIKEFIKQINIEMKREDSGIGVIDYARASVIIDNLAGERFK